MAPTGLRIDVWDVGQGDCTVITLPDGSLFLIDVGPLNSPVISWLDQRRDLRITCVALTHNDADHCGALTPLIEVTAGRLSRIVALKEPQRTQAQFISLFRRAIELQKAGKLDISRLEAPMELWRDPQSNTSLEVVFPNMIGVELARSKNESSAIIILRCDGKILAVWPGDNLVKRVAENIDGNHPFFMMGPHHGCPQDGKKSEARQHLDRINPKHVLVSVGSNNRYNHPSQKYIKSAIARLSHVACTQITRQCDPSRAEAQRPIMDGSSLLGLRPCPSGTPCRGSMRFNLINGELVPDQWHQRHQDRVNLLRRPLCKERPTNHR